MRVDAQSAAIISTQQMAETPEILKILYRGTSADLGLIERIRAQEHPTLEAWWRESIGNSDRGGLVGAGRGYQTIKPSSRVRKKGDGLPGAPAEYLHGLPDVTLDSLERLLIDTAQLPLFQYDRVHDPRDPRLFQAPIAVVHQSPPAELGRIRVGVADKPVAYNESYYGYCPGETADAGLFVRYLALVIGSRLGLWFALMTSGKFGFERDVIEKAAIDRMPLPDFRSLPKERRDEAASLFDDVVHSKRRWDDVDRWVAALYGLGPADLQIITDTLAYGLPFAETKIAAQARPDEATKNRFCARLKSELEPWAQRFNTSVQVCGLSTRATSPWFGVLVQTTAEAPPSSVADWEALVSLADATAATELIVEDGRGGLLIGRLAQNRFWSETQARLLAQHIAWSHLDVLKDRTGA
jgi:hypothetical protein